MQTRRRRKWWAVAGVLLVLALAWTGLGTVRGEQELYRQLARELKEEGFRSISLVPEASAFPSEDSLAVFLAACDSEQLQVGVLAAASGEDPPSLAVEGETRCGVSVSVIAGIYSRTSIYCGWGPRAGVGWTNNRVFVFWRWVGLPGGAKVAV
ncbi:MAG: hypothetical protein Kow0062_11190 [Acidobacteriota bacterium]